MAAIPEPINAVLADAGLASVDERGITCCYAMHDKSWVEGAPDGERREVYTVLADRSDLRRPRRSRVVLR